MMVRNLAILVVSVALLAAMQLTKPGYAEITAPIVSTADWKQAGATRSFKAEITGAKVARRLKSQSKTLTTSGVWVLIGVKAEALQESTTIGGARWVAQSGIEYLVSDRMPVRLELLTNNRLEPGIPKPGVLVFEIPEHELRGGTLHLQRSRFAPLGGELALSAGPIGDAPIEDEFDLQL